MRGFITTIILWIGIWFVGYTLMDYGPEIKFITRPLNQFLAMLWMSSAGIYMGGRCVRGGK